MLTYAMLRDTYHRSFGDRVLRLNFLRFLNQNVHMKKLHNLFVGVFLFDDFICTDCGCTDEHLRGDCPQCGKMSCAECSYAVCGECHKRNHG